MGMNVYRAAESRASRIRYGRAPRWRALRTAVGVVLLALGGVTGYGAVAMVADALRSGALHHDPGLIVLVRWLVVPIVPVLVGLSVILGRTSGFVELSEDGVWLTVARKSPWPWRRTAVAHDLVAIDVSSWAPRELRLYFRDGSTISLVKGATNKELETDRVAISDWLVEHRLLSRTATGRDAPLTR
jgi:hypothetical protein